MKHALLLALSIALIFLSCGKSNEEPSVEGKTCQISIAANENHKYDAEGRLINISNSADPAGVNITYSKDMITILGSNKIPNIKLILVNGRVTEATTVSSTTTNYEFSYDMDGYMSKAVMFSGGEVHTYTYSYTGGNLTKIEGTKNSSGKLSNHPTITVEHSTELASNIAEIGIPMEKPFIFSRYKVDKYFGKQSKNLVSKVTELGTSVSFTYTKDVNGNITSVKRSDSNPYLIMYMCK